MIKEFKDSAEEATELSKTATKAKATQFEADIKGKQFDKDYLTNRGIKINNNEKDTNEFVERKIKRFYKVGR